MKRSLAMLSLAFVAATLSGCYYDPDYSYVRRSGYQGDVYYGRAAPVYDDGYYAAPGYYGYYGCCYAPGVSVGISRTWYGGSRYRHGHAVRPWHDGHRGGHGPSHRAADHRDRRGDGHRSGGHRDGGSWRGRGRDHRDHH